MNDMSKVVIPKSDQLNADSLLTGPRTITITGVEVRVGAEQPVTVHYDGEDGRPWKPCKTMSRLLIYAWGPDANAYVGKSVVLYRDPKVKWAGKEEGGIRVLQMSDIPPEKIDSSGRMVVMLTETRGSRKPHVIMPLVVEQNAAKPDPATAWTNAYLAKVAEAATAEALEAFVSEKAAKLSELETKRPDLHQQCVDAVASRREALAGDFMDDDFTEGRDDADMGEGFTDDETTTRLTNIRNSIAAAQNAKGLQHVEAEWINARAAHDDDTVAEIEQLIAERKRAIERREEG